MRSYEPPPAFRRPRSLELPYASLIVAFCMGFIQFPTLCLSQSMERRAAIPAGAQGDAGGASLEWTLGQPASASYASLDQLVTAGVQQPEGVSLALNLRMLLDGPYRPAADLMHDSLRSAGLLPFNTPYTALGFSPVGWSGGGTFPSGILLTDGPDAIVDWVFLELRDALDPTVVLSSRSALLQRDGDVVDRDGTSPVRITALPGNYHVAVFHRNHLPAMTMAPLALGLGVNAIDLSDGSIATHGSEAQRLRNGRWLLWAGDVTGDGVVSYTGVGNDRDAILQSTGGVIPTATTSGYLPQDVNMDGTVKYTGEDNDRDPVLQTIGGTVPTNVRIQQMP